VTVNDERVQLALLAGEGRSVLHVGVGDGSLARALTDRGCLVSGVDVDPEAARTAATTLVETVVADLDTEPLSTYFKRRSFEVVVVGGVLRHVTDPVALLRDAAGLMVDGGRLLVAVPNAVHGALRLGLLQGSTPAEESRHAFTKDSLCDALEDAGLSIEELRSTVRDPLDAGVAVDDRRLPPLVIEWMRHQPDAMDHTYVVTARRSAPVEESRPRPLVQPVVPLADVRIVDEHTRRMAEDRDVRHRLLTVRDHILGLEANAAGASVRVARATARAKHSERRSRRRRRQVELLVAELEWLAGSSSRVPRRYKSRITELLRTVAEGETTDL